MAEKQNTPEIRFEGFTDPWEQRKLGDCFEFLKNNTLSRADLNGENGTARNVHYGDILIKFGDCLDGERSDLPFITDDTVLPKFAGSILREGDVIFADTAEDEAAGKCVELRKLPKEPTISGLHTIPARPRFPFGSGYLGHYLNSDAYHRQLLPLMQGIKVISVSKAALQDTQVRFPRLSEQAAIGAALSEIDNLITLHQRKHDKLCTLKKSMLDKMFPKPGETEPEIRFEGFTDPWEQRKWSEYVSISTDMVDPRSGNYDNLPHVGPGNMESFTGRLYDNVNTVKDDALISGKFHFNPGDIIYGKINPQLGKYTYAQFEGLASADAYVLNGKNGLTQEFLFGILQTKAFFDYSVSVSMRSGMPKINRDELNAFEFLAPNESEQRAIGDILLKLDDLITLHQRKLELLRNIKKSLLDRMFV